MLAPTWALGSQDANKHLMQYLCWRAMHEIRSKNPQSPQRRARSLSSFLVDPIDKLAQCAGAELNQRPTRIP